ncbi:MAG: GTP 3',8-cyclase MoaA [Gammaproteobacteria bacterium HGW-Gammaproteobacteria-1]|jgi:cyclic pyranopterin phosphate synthase|nr:MAG: GTP 3',8-cyclase MoaA [Gammaproteobacteria bacterium HGW-Gammaproteobacteria-1]
MQTLTDSFGRRITYLRLSLTDHCNLRCRYCMPEDAHGSGRARRLSLEETARLVGLFARMGVERFRLTGGEPLLRKDLVPLAAALTSLPGVRDLSLSTNALLLEQSAAALAAAGVGRLNISLDSLQPERFADITGGGDLAAVLRGIEAARAAGMTPIKLNMVALNGINDDEITAMAEFAQARGLELRYIETMPVGGQGEWSMRHHLPAEQIMVRLKEHYGTDLLPQHEGAGGPARMYRIGAHGPRIGVISAVSRHFCASCNRVRLTAAGDLVLCLGNENSVSLREPMRAGMDDEALCDLIRAAILRKPERHDFNAPQVAPLRPMYALGG